MSQIKGLELLFNLEKNNLKSKEDCVVTVFHCLLINDGFQCVGIGDEWPLTLATPTELLPNEWNSNQNVYSLRYISKDSKSRLLLKITKMEHILQVDVVKNEDAVASMSVPVENHIDNYSDFSTTYKDLESLGESFRKEVMESFEEPKPKKEASKTPKRLSSPVSSIPPPPPYRRPADLRHDNPHPSHPRFPRVGGRDLDPFGSGGGMFMDPASFGVPSHPTLPDFGVGGPGGLPRGSVPPGARFDPFMPPNHPSNRFRPNPDHFKPPDFDDDFM